MLCIRRLDCLRSAIAALASGNTACQSGCVALEGLSNAMARPFLTMLTTKSVNGVRSTYINSQRLPRLSRSQRRVTSMQLQISRWDESRGPVTRDKVLSQLREEGYSTTVYTFSPGTRFGDHSHSCEKKDSIIHGDFLFRMDDEEVVLRPGDMLVVPAGRTHYAEVVGQTACEFVDASKSS